jgi:DNA-binding IclR family transcriptional regulator
MPTKRTDDFYEIEALTKGLAVLEALEGTNFEPVTVPRIVNRCKLPRDVVMRSLKTFRLRGWAIQNARGEWTIGKRLRRFAIKAGEIEQL